MGFSRVLYVVGPLCIASSSAMFAQGVLVPDSVCKPASMRTSEIGCWILADQSVGEMKTKQVFWRLYIYADRKAAEADKVPNSLVVESLGKVWLMTFGAEKWNSAHGTHVADIGPLPLPASGQYSAQIMEAIFSPGMTAPSHNHPGPEAWYTTAGETCLETSDGRTRVGRPGGPPVIVPAGLAMALTATGNAQRRSIVLILHPTNVEPVIMNHEWTPKGLCRTGVK